MVVAVAVALATQGALAGFIGTAASAATATTAATAATGLTAAIGSTAAGFVGGAIAGAAGSIASQALGVATGIQDQFSWTSVASSALAGGLGGAGKLGVGGSSIGSNAARAMVSNVLSQGANIALGPQSKFSWASVAASGVGSFAGGKFGASKFGQALASSSFASQIGAGTASAIANAATRTALGDGNFGDNIRAAIPDVIGQAIGGAIGRGLATNLTEQGAVQSNSVSPETLFDADGQYRSDAITNLFKSDLRNRGATEDQIAELLSFQKISDSLAELDLSFAGATPEQIESRIDSAIAEQDRVARDGNIDAEVRLEKVVVYGVVPGPSAETTISGVASGGLGLVEGLADFSIERPLLAELGYSATCVALGGPPKTVLRRVAGEAGGQLVDRMVAVPAGNAVGSAVQTLAHRHGWTATFGLAGYAAEADAATLGGGANLLTNIIVSMGASASLGKTVESINLARSAWVTGRKAQKVFRQGIEQAGRGVTSGKWHAHHFVPLGWKSDAAERARERLGHFEIDINSVMSSDIRN